MVHLPAGETAEDETALPLPSCGRLAALAVLYFAVAVLATWPLAPRAADHVFGLGTPPLNVWAIGVVQRNLFRNPLALFEGNAFYPYHDTLAFSEHLFAPAVLGLPVAWATGNLVLTHNLVALLSYALAGMGMFLLARELTGHVWGSLAAGAFYAVNTWNINELIRLQIISNQWFPWLLLALLRFFSRPSRRAAAFVGGAYLAQSLSCMYWALYAPMLVGAAVVALQWRYRVSLRDLGWLALALGAAATVLVPFAQPYLRLSEAFGWTRELPAPIALDRYLDVLPGSWLFSGLLDTAKPNRDAAHFLGFSTLGLALIGLLAGQHRHRSLRWPALLGLAGLLSLALSLGPELRVGDVSVGRAPYLLLREYVPGFRNVRYPERFAVFVALALGPLAAAGVAGLGRRVRFVGPLALGIVILEHLSVPLPLEPLPTANQVPEAHRWLAAQENIGVVVDLPAAHHLMDRADALPMYLSTFHWKRTPQGFTGYYPPIQNYVRWRLHHFPEPESVAFLQRFGVDAAILAPGYPLDRLPPELAALPRESFPSGQHVVRLPSNTELLEPPPADPVDLREVSRKGWLVQASETGARFAVDGDSDTAWSTVREQRSHDYFLVRLAESTPVARISLAVTRPFHFPTSLRLFARRRGQGRREVPIDLAVSHDQMFRRLLHEPREATLDIDLPDTLMDAFQIEVAEGDGFLLPWSIPELRVFVRRGDAQ